MPPIHDSMDPMHAAPGSALTAHAAPLKDEPGSKKRTLFGDVPEAKRRKFILVEDTQRGARVRVRVMLEQVNMGEMPDSYLQANAVFPRSYYPRQVGTSKEPRELMEWDDEDDESEGAPSAPGKTVVPVRLLDETEAKLSVPRMTTSRRNKELALNELGYRMAWGQARTFNERTLFLQRSRECFPLRLP